MVQGRIISIETDNFKSYSGKHVIGPFADFTAIIGPNGSGKSNVMDAISFVLGVRASNLRGNNVVDLLHVSPDGAKADRASVTLVFEKKDSDGPVEYRLTRIARIDGSSQYRINNSVVTYDKYDETLRSLGILVKTKNFLVFQGDVESISTKSSRELTSVLEHVSGSDNYKEAYDTAKATLDKATESTVFAFQKKRGIRNEKIHCEEQKKEAERWQALEEDRKGKSAIQMLWELWLIEDENRQLVEQMNELNDGVQKLSNRQVTARETIKEKKKAAAAVHKNVVKKERNVKELQDELAALKPASIKAQKAVEHHKTKIANQKRALKTAEAQLSDQDKHLGQMRADVNRLRREKQEFELEVQAMGAGVTLEQKQLEEYHRLKELCDAKLSREREEDAKLLRAQKSDQDELKALQRKDQELATRLGQLKEQEQIINEHLRVNQESQARAQREIADAEKEAAKIRDERSRLDEEEKVLEASIETTLQQMREMKVDQEENDRDSRRQEALDNMKRLFPGVRGRLFDLVDVLHKKYTNALVVALGKNLDAVVVDTQAVGIECVHYLREQKVPPMTFLPLDSIRASPANDVIRSYVATWSGAGTADTPKKRAAVSPVALLLDVIKFDERITTAVNYALVNVAVCDTLTTAKRVAFNNGLGLRIRTVTLDGTVIERSGLMSGGLSDTEKRARKWDDKEGEKLKARKAALSKELTDVKAKRYDLHKDKVLECSIATLNTRILDLDLDTQVSKDKLTRNEREMRAIESARIAVGPERMRVEASLVDRSAAISKISETIKVTQDKIFKDLCAAIGVDNIRDYEQGKMRRIAEIGERRCVLEQSIAKAENAMQNLQSADYHKSVATMESVLARLGTELQTLEADHSEQQAKLSTLQDKVKAAQAQAKALEDEEREIDVEIKALTSAYSTAMKEGGKLHSQLTSYETQFQANRSRRSRVLTKCRMERVPVPLADGRTLDSADADIDEAISRSGRASLEGSRSQGESQAQPTPRPATQSGPDSYLASQAVLARVEADEGIVLEFEKLPRNIRNPGMSGDQKTKIRKNLDDAVRAVVNELEKMEPNLRAIERLDGVSERWKLVSDDHNKARQELKEAETKFRTLKKQRYDSFMKAFNAISEKIDDVYKRLTRSEQQPLGGRAYLTLENSEEPYLEGVRYNAMPPLKRFRDMDQLSGGEKTVAALALLFAIHSFQPSPFFVLDEIDASLDNANVMKVARYLKHKCDDVQVIVISLKELLYSGANSLVGVCRDNVAHVSKTLTLDLKRYPVA